MNKVKTVRITLCTFRIANFFTRCSAKAVHPEVFPTTTSAKVTAQKRSNLAGATPLLTAFSRPKFCGVAPARHRGTVTVFCPRAYTDVINPECREETIPNNERRKYPWQY